VGKNMDKWLGDGGMPILTELGAAIDGYGDGWSTTAWTPTKIACNPAGTVQAGVYAVLLDSAMNFAINAGLDGRDRSRATLEMKTETMRSAKSGEPLVVRGEVVRMAKQVAYAEATVKNEAGELVARSTATFLLHREDPAPA